MCGTFFILNCRYVTSFETGNQPVTDIFHFIVYDGENNRLDGQMYTITITPVLKHPPVVTVHGDIKVSLGPCNGPSYPLKSDVTAVTLL